MAITRLFISYSHDSPEHKEQVLGLSERLRLDGYDCQIDRYVNGSPDEGWPRWMLNSLDRAECVLVVCTETYYRRFRGHEVPGKGKGGDFEGALITQEIFDARSHALRFVPIVFQAQDEQYIPEPLRGPTRYVLNCESNYEELCAFLDGVAGIEPHKVVPRVPPERSRAEPSNFPSEGASEAERGDLDRSSSSPR